MSMSKTAVNPTSTGLWRLVPVGGRTAERVERVCSESEASSRPLCSQASAAETANPPGPEMTAKRFPKRLDRREKPINVSTQSSNPTTGIAPAWRTTPSQISPEVAMAPVCEAAALDPSSVSPAFHRMTGFSKHTFLIVLRNRGPFFMPSR